MFVFIYLYSGSVHGSSSCAVLSFCFCFGPTSGWWLKMISTTSTGESVIPLCDSSDCKLCMKTMFDKAGTSSDEVTISIDQLLLVHTPGQYITALESGGMRQSPSWHPPLWDSATLHS